MTASLRQSAASVIDRRSQRQQRATIGSHRWHGVLTLAIALVVAAALVVLLGASSGRVTDEPRSAIADVPMGGGAASVAVVSIGESPLFGSAFLVSTTVDSVQATPVLAPAPSPIDSSSRGVPATSGETRPSPQLDSPADPRPVGPAPRLPAPRVPAPRAPGTEPVARAPRPVSATPVRPDVPTTAPPARPAGASHRPRDPAPDVAPNPVPRPHVPPALLPPSALPAAPELPTVTVDTPVASVAVGDSSVSATLPVVGPVTLELSPTSLNPHAASAPVVPDALELVASSDLPVVSSLLR